MPEYIDLEIETDADALADDAITYLETAVPGWEAAPGNIETLLIESIAAMAAEQALVASQVPLTVFRYFGSELMHLPPLDGVAATGVTTWTMADTDGRTIPVDTVLSIQDVVFTVATDVVISPGEPSGTVPIVAAEVGVAGNDLVGPVALVDTLAYVNAITLDGTTAGGIDAETDDDYMNRLVDVLQLMAPRPILPTDFEALARSIVGVERTVAVDGFNPADDSYDNERMVAIAAVDVDGEDIPAATKTELHDYLVSLREINFVVNVIPPTYFTINVTTTIIVLPGFDPASVQNAVVGSLTDFFQPSQWGRMMSGDGLISRPWVNSSKVGRVNVGEAIKRVEGVAYVPSISITGDGTASGDDRMLTPAPAGQPFPAAPLTRPGTITVNLGT